MEKGYLVVNVYADDISKPVENATVKIKGNDFEKVYKTNNSGKTELIELYAPKKEYSLNPQKQVKPYSQYDIKVTKDGLQTTIIKNVEILPDETSIQNVFMASIYEKNMPESITELPEHVLWGDYAPKIPEEFIKTEEDIESKNLRVLLNVSIPEYVIVHDGTPTSTNVSNYYVNFTDYIKNVASSEIYSTWPTETIKANVYAILSFTMNRIFTEWYRTKGYDFTITSTPAYDQKYTHNGTVFKTISDVVDQIFNYYIKLPNVFQPFFAQYNDGIKTNNPGWLSQWGSKDLGDKGYKAIDILKYYYINTLTLERAEEIEGLPTSFPGYNLKLDSCGEPVLKLQNRLNVIRGSYPAIPIISPADGQFKQDTKNAVEKFQEVFGLTKDGIVGFNTWYKISYIYVAVTKMIQGIV